MAVTTFSAALTITPVVIKTFFKHWVKKIKRIKDGGEEKPQDDIFFNQAFHIVKSFIALGSENTVESLQAFTNTHVPAPPWAAVCPVLIPLKTCNEAADRLIEWFGPEDLETVVGGDRWWQVRGLDGVDAEWVAEEEDLAPDRDEFHMKDGKRVKDTEADILRMEKLESVMLYVHGGGYFWGSINTHRYQILHFAHKFRGRAFAVNYRKAPQYPWPCPLQDVLAAYLYLIQPPPEALHRPVPHQKIVFAGDSAGGGLCLTALAILRDLGMPLPSGAVLISPWVDLTHSFPSVIANQHTDIIPKHGFLAKPSTVWPNPTIPDIGGRVVPTTTNPPPPPGKADTLKPSLERLHGKTDEGTIETGKSLKSQEVILDDYSNPDIELGILSLDGEESKHHWEPKPPKVLMENSNTVPLELRSQIQMYAPTELLTHPLVSPVLQASLGNLPPLYIIAGDGEVLRDEIVYLAHKAANPASFPTRPGVLRECRRQKENAEKFTTPTKVHLQVFDGMCHVLTVFMFTKSAKYAYRSIGEFIKYVTQHEAECVERDPFPKSHRHQETDPADDKYLQKRSGRKARKSKGKKTHRPDVPAVEEERANLHGSPRSDAQAIVESKEMVTQEVEEGTNTTGPSVHKQAASFIEVENPTDSKQLQFEQGHDTPTVHFLRERVDIHCKVRPMESPGEIPALQLQPLQIGLIKEAPTLRWHDGQKIWDKRYRKDTQRVLKQRAKCEVRAATLLKNAFDQGFIHGDADVNRQAADMSAVPSVDGGAAGQDTASTLPRPSRKLKRPSSLGEIQADRRWGPLDLYGERPPATAIAGRRDTPEAVALLKKSLYHTAPRTHKTVPKMNVMGVVAATLDPHDDPNRPPRQSVSEQQVKANLIPVHGLKVWDGLLRYFGQKTSAKGASDNNKAVGGKIGSSGEGRGADTIETNA